MARLPTQKDHNMLCLSRKKGQQLRIGHDVIVKVLGFSSHGVELGVDAPKSMTVDREEVYLQKYPAKGATDAGQASER